MALGIREIDEQHRDYLDVVRELSDTVNVPDKRVVAGLTIVKLMSYINFHFATEERYFEMFHYPEADSHIAAHRAFGEKIAEFRDRHFAREEDVTTELVEFLGNWLAIHVREMDQRYVECFHEHGLK